MLQVDMYMHGVVLIIDYQERDIKMWKAVSKRL